MIRQSALLLVALCMSACATLERHPVATAVAVGFIAGSIAASQSGHTSPTRGGDFPAICRATPESCK